MINHPIFTPDWKLSHIYNSLNFLRPFTHTMDKPMKIIHIFFSSMIWALHFVYYRYSTIISPKIWSSMKNYVSTMILVVEEYVVLFWYSLWNSVIVRILYSLASVKDPSGSIHDFFLPLVRWLRARLCQINRALFERTFKLLSTGVL